MEKNKDVRLIAITMPVDEANGAKDANDIISYCARVSNPSNQTNFDTAGKLLAYCLKKKHWSIFEQVNLTFEITTTRDIGRQILRHSTLKPQEFSQRYADPTELGYVTREARLQDTTNRQNSIELEDSNLPSKQKAYIHEMWKLQQEKLYESALDVYEWAISQGIAKEQARAVLPEGMTKTRIYFNGNLRNWYHFCQVRTDKATQKEHRLIALQIWEILQERFPFLKEVEDVT